MALTVSAIPGLMAPGSWMDHQWGNFTVFGMLWDWFSLRLDDGGSIMIYQLRNTAGRTLGTSWTCRTAQGSLSWGETGRITSQRLYADLEGLCPYPLGWTVSLDALDAEFLIEPLFDEQLFFSLHTPDYWEGLCSLKGFIAGQAVTGDAYVELAGYCDPVNHLKGH